MCVVEPVRVVVILQQLLVRDLKQTHVLLVQPGVPDVIQDGHLFKLAALLVRAQRGWERGRGQAGLPPSRRRDSGFLQEETLAFPHLLAFKPELLFEAKVGVGRVGAGAGAGEIGRLQLLHIHVLLRGEVLIAETKTLKSVSVLGLKE